MIDEEQCGFRTSRRSIDQVCEKYQGKGKEVHWNVMDLEKVYDIELMGALWNMLWI